MLIVNLDIPLDYLDPHAAALADDSNEKVPWTVILAVFVCTFDIYSITNSTCLCSSLGEIIASCEGF